MKVTYRFEIRQPVVTPDGKLGTVLANFTNDVGNFALVQFPAGPVIEQKAFEDRLLQAAIAQQ
jgi:hypothetical protein